MTAKNLSTVTTDMIGAYGNTARNVIQAYRAGGERMIGFVDRRWEYAVGKSASRLSAEMRANAITAQKRLSNFYCQGVTVTTDGAEAIVSKVVELAENSVTQVAANASRFEQATGVTSLQALATVAVPAVEAVGKIASKIEHQTSLLLSRIGQKTVKVKAVAVKPAARAKVPRTRKAA